MIKFEPDSSITGGAIDDWYVDNDDLVNRTKIIRTQPKKLVDSGTASEFPLKESNVNLYQNWLDSRSRETNIVEKMCNDRLKLLAKLYSDSITPEFARDIKARVLILEYLLGDRMPRYTEQDWELLMKFQQSIEELKK